MNKITPVRVKAVSLSDMINEARAKAEAEQRRVAAMSDEEYKAYQEAETVRQAEVEELLKQLRGPGFMEIKIPLTEGDNT
jgi:phosphoglycolate phosphatase-like HAD superfamily hydrolase